MASNQDSERVTIVGRVLQAMVGSPGKMIGGLAVMTAVLVVAGIISAPDKDASFDPSGEEFDTGDLVDRTFQPSTTELLFIVEDEGADALDQASLREWHRNSEELRAPDELSDELSTYFDDDLGITVSGTYSIADAVDDQLRADGVPDGLEAASEDQVKQALSSLLAEDQPTALFRDQLSVHGGSTKSSVGGSEIDLWTAPAFVAPVRVDHAAFPLELEDKSDPATRTDAQQSDIDEERALEIEEWARDAQEVLRGDEQFYQAWGVAIDESLTDDESFEAALPFLVGAIALIVFLVGLLLRSYWAAALAGSGLGVTLLWARMITNIIGFEESVILDVIVPIATISFGIDFMIHAVSRCREELTAGKTHRTAYVIGIATVGGALGLALATSGIAFGSNATSGIPGVIQFGFGAAIALGAAFVMLGVLAPMFLLRIEEELARAPAASGRILARAGAGFRIFIASLFATAVIIAIIGVPFIGAVGVVAYAILIIAIPFWWTRRSLVRAAADAPASSGPTIAGQSMARAGIIVAGIVRMRYATLAVIAVATAFAALGAIDVGSKFEPKDFAPSDSDLVVSIDKVLEHSELLGTGDVLIFVEGDDLADPRTLRSAAAVVESVEAEGGDVFARNPDGSFAVPDSALDVARAASGVPFASQTISSETGVPLTDDDSDGFPDTAQQVGAVFSYASINGIPSDETTFVYTAEEVSQLLATHDGEWATVLSFPLQGFASSGQVRDARDAVEAGEADLLSAASSEGLTLGTSISGGALTQQLRIDAITDAMLVSVPLAMVLVLIVASLAMRSARLALASIIPIALVITWLLAFMSVFGYNLNVVTATIAAISVGVGIDYSIHFTMRFREEWRRSGDRLEGVRLAAEGTGTALILSAATSVTGFLFLAFAPMPVFAAYGLLTAVMIALSLLASLTVLPSLLYILTPGEATSDERVPARAE
jgi:predicted RND superfamily exporter protein